MRFIRFTGGLAIAAAIACGSTATGQLLVSDSFPVDDMAIDQEAANAAGDYYVSTEGGATALAGQMPQGILGEDDFFGWAGNTSNFQADAGNRLTHDAVGYNDGSGGMAKALGVANDTFLTRYRNRNLLPTSSETFYMSGLINRGSGGEAPINPGSYALMGFTNAITNGTLLDDPNGPDGNMFGLTWGFGGDDFGDGYDLVLRHRVNDGIAIGPLSEVLLADAAANTTYLVVLKFELNQNSPDANRGNDAVTYWVGGDQTGFDVSSELTATATAEATGTLASFGFNTSTDLTRILLAQRGYEAPSAFFDEARLGLDFASVVQGEMIAMLAADFDDNGTVNGDDFLIWQANFGTPSGATKMTGDANGDEAVNGDDFLIWQSEFGQSLPGDSLAVPEPGTVGLAVPGLLVFVLRRRRLRCAEGR